MAYSTIKDPSAHFYAYAFSKSSGTGSATFDGNSDLQPDFLWVKSRTNADSHELWDSTRGVNSTLFSDSTSAEDTAANRIVSFDTDGFTWGNAGNLNAAGDFVSWAWKANGGTTSTNTDGSITTTTQVNSDAGFSIITYTGTGSTATVGHGLGVAPKIIIGKRRNGTSNWWFGGSILTSTQTLYPNLTNAIDNVSESVINNVTTSTTFKLGTDTNRNAASGTHVAYCFAEKQGYSKFGTYVGNGDANGPFVYTGFKPAFVLIKRTDSADNWFLYDTKRSPFNEADEYIRANITNAEGSNNFQIDMLSNGFKTRNSGSFIGALNASGGSYIYMAFAEHPFVAGGVPTTAR